MRAVVSSRPLGQAQAFEMNDDVLWRLFGVALTAGASSARQLGFSDRRKLTHLLLLQTADARQARFLGTGNIIGYCRLATLALRKVCSAWTS